MALIDEVQRVCERLASAGWRDLLMLHGLDIQARPLADELKKALSIDRTIKGFEDFSLQGSRGIESGHPARSLLYHALASPNVTEGAGAKPLAEFPTAAELETLLNYVYGVSPPTLAQLQALAGADAILGLVVFAYEYRPKPDTTHRKYADLCFSRTGIARVGTAPLLYDARLRGFSPFVQNQPQAMRVIPARFGAFIAVQQKGGVGRGWRSGDEELNFWCPLHMVFNGTECINGLDVDSKLEAFHVNDKLRQFQIRRGTEADWFEPDLSKAPFVLTDDLAEWGDSSVFGAGLNVPVPKRRLVEPALFNNQLVSFRVPPGANFGGYIINKRHQLQGDGSIRDLNKEPDVDAIVSAGNYQALHFIDFTAEGWVKPICPALSAHIPIIVVAYSILSAPDFYPSCGQAALIEWEQQQAFPEPIWYVSLQALSELRLAGNPQLPGGHFGAEDKGITALVYQRLPGVGTATVGPSPSAQRPSWLPDHAAGTFSPGWEISTDGGFRPTFLCAFNLGSPFSEDVRICSAAGGYWPAVTPDSARTFEPDGTKPTVIPLPDSENGQTSQPSWDGETGPRLVVVGGREVVECTAYTYSDYTNRALAGQLSLSVTGQTSREEYQQRILAMQSAYIAVGATTRQLQGAWAVLSFVPIVRSDSALAKAESAVGKQLGSTVHFFKIYKYGAISTPSDFTRRHVEILEMVELFIGEKNLLMNKDNKGWQIRSRD
ncbi:hypothetical protein [Pseudomonas frederiksbergensis]|jgi:hypothetical protein|uniref:hypothetical protein n=1 Tax=Pseudomonas frederiksbergensis TaxID=104087 RepID=UPI003D213DE6